MKFVHITSADQSKQKITTFEKVVYFMHNYSGELILDIAHENAEVYIYGLYIGKGTDKFTIKTTQQHSKGKNVSDLFIKGIFSDDAKFAYEGLIRIEKGAQQANAYQKNQNLLLSSHAFVDSRPFLEIEADDVRCTHGSTTGNLNKDQLLYLETRGLAPNKARRLLLEGFVVDLFNSMQRHIPAKTLNPIKKACLRALA